MWQPFSIEFQGFVKKKIKYIHQNLKYYETIVHLLYLSRNHLPLLLIYKNKMVTSKNLILKYIGVKNINILKRKCHVGINVAFLELILKLYDVCFMKTKFHCHHTSWFFLIHLLLIRAIFKEFMHHLTHKFYIFFQNAEMWNSHMYKFPQNNLYSNNIIADNLRKIHISENREKLTVQRLIYQRVN